MTRSQYIRDRANTGDSSSDGVSCPTIGARPAPQQHIMKPVDSCITTSWTCLLSICTAVLSTPLAAADTAVKFEVPAAVQGLLISFCADCHGKQGEGNVNLRSLDQLPINERLNPLNKVQDQLFYGMMPPAASGQPDAQSRRALAAWVRTELKRHSTSKLDERLLYLPRGTTSIRATLQRCDQRESLHTGASLAGQPADFARTRPRFTGARGKEPKNATAGRPQPLHAARAFRHSGL